VLVVKTIDTAEEVERSKEKNNEEHAKWPQVKWAYVTSDSMDQICSII
jgi:hypothetical protein